MFISLFCTLDPACPRCSACRPIPVGSRGLLCKSLRWSSGGLVDLPLRHPRAIRGAALVHGNWRGLPATESALRQQPTPRARSVQRIRSHLQRAVGEGLVVPLVAERRRAESASPHSCWRSGWKHLDVVERVVTVVRFHVPRGPAAEARYHWRTSRCSWHRRLGPDGRGAGSHRSRNRSQRFVDLDREVSRLIAGFRPSVGADLECGAGSRLRSRSLSPDDSKGLPRIPLREIEGASGRSCWASLPEQLRISQHCALSAGHVTLQKSARTRSWSA